MDIYEVTQRYGSIVYSHRDKGILVAFDGIDQFVTMHTNNHKWYCEVSRVTKYTQGMYPRDIEKLAMSLTFH